MTARRAHPWLHGGGDKHNIYAPVVPGGIGRGVEAKAAADTQWYERATLEPSDEALVQKQSKRSFWRMPIYAKNRKDFEAALQYDTTKETRAQEWAIARKARAKAADEDRAVNRARKQSAKRSRDATPSSSGSSSQSATETEPAAPAPDDTAVAGDAILWVLPHRASGTLHLEVPPSGSLVRLCKPHAPLKTAAIYGVGVRDAKQYATEWCHDCSRAYQRQTGYLINP